MRIDEPVVLIRLPSSALSHRLFLMGPVRVALSANLSRDV